MPEQIFDLNELAGRMIGRAVELGGDMQRVKALGLIFTDGSFFRVAPFAWDEGLPDIIWGDRPTSLDELAEFGLISAEELESRKAAAAAEEQARHLARERAEYERLRAKFEPTQRPGPTP